MLWLDVKTQWRAGFGLVGLDYGEVRRRAAELDIDLSECMWGKIRALEQHTLNRQNQDD